MINLTGYKGLDKDFKCKDFQYKVGETYHLDGEIKICERGFHFCDTPLAVFNFYPPVDSRFALVEANGSLAQDKDDEHKFCTDELTILKELTLGELISATNSGDCSAATNSGDRSVATNSGDCSTATNSGDGSAATNSGYHSVATNSGYHSVATNSGYRSAATNSGYRSAATNSGDRSAATNSGDYSVATNSGDHSAASVAGKQSVALVTGANSKAKGTLGCWIVLSEWANGTLAEVKAFKVDGQHIKPDTFYSLIKGQAVEILTC